MRAIELLLALLPVVTLASPQRLSMTSIPRELELRTDARATLRMSAPEVPRLHASVGEVEAPRLVASGIYEATYVPPREFYPQVAIITATTPQGFGWLAIPLAGTGELQVKTNPGGEATVQIGDRTFGPVRADSQGRALVPIVVPPGTSYAMVGKRRVPLEAPVAARPVVVLEPSSVPASARSNVAVRVVVVTAAGAPRRNAPLRLEASEGVLSAPRELEPGVFEASWDVPAGPEETASLSAWIAGEAGASSRASLLRATSPTSPRASEAPEIASAPTTSAPPTSASKPSPRPTPAPSPRPTQEPTARATPPPSSPKAGAPAPAAEAPATAAPVSPPVAQARIPPPRPGGVPTRPVIDRTRFEAPPSDVAIDLRSGAAWDREGLRALTAGVQVAWFPRPLSGYVGLALDGSGLAVQEKERALVSGRNLEVSAVARVFPIQGVALLRLPLLGGRLVAGAGGGSAYGVVRTAARTQPTLEVSGWATSLTALLGYGHPAGGGSLFAEVRAQQVATIAEQRVPGALELLSVSLGYRFEL